MNKDEQIVEIKECVDAVYGMDCAYYDVDGFAIAEEVYNAGYRKQSEGKWVQHNDGFIHCSVCDYAVRPLGITQYCPYCGTRLKGADKEKQIEEMADDVRRIRESYFGQADYLFAMKLYEDGYRKQSEGEWIPLDNFNGKTSIVCCSNCDTRKGLAALAMIETVTKEFPYCEKCGVKMKGGNTP